MANGTSRKRARDLASRVFPLPVGPTMHTTSPTVTVSEFRLGKPPADRVIGQGDLVVVSDHIAVGYDAATEDPEGGVIRRRAGSSEPDGVLEETAFFAAIVKLMGDIGEAGARAFAEAGSELWARFGYTTAEEGRSLPSTVAMLQKIADEGSFAIDVVTYVDVLADRDFIADVIDILAEAGVTAIGLDILIDQPTDDDFLGEELKPGSLEQACICTHHPLQVNMREGYDHSYFFIASFIDDHLRYHARALGLPDQAAPAAGSARPL